MPNDQTLSIIVKLQDEASTQLEALSAKMKSVGDSMASTASSVGAKMTEMGNSMQTFGKGMQSAGQSLSIGLTLPIVALGTAVVDASMKFQSAMELIRTQAGASQVEVDNMTKAVLAMAKSGETGQGPQKLAEGLYHVESLGYRGAQALDILKASANAADVGMANMEDVTNALGAAIVTGIKGTETMNGAMGTLNATIGSGNMRMQDLAAALGTGILPSAKNFGLTLTDVGAALATLTDNGMRADEAATRLRMTFSLMAAPTKKASDALGSIGLTQLQLAEDMRSKGLIGAIQDLNDHLNATQPAHTVLVKASKMTEEQISATTEKLKNAQAQLAILTETHVKAGVATDKHNLAIEKAKQTINKYKEQLAGANQVLETTGGTMLSASEKAQVLSEAFGGGRTSAAILTLTDQVDRLGSKYKQITENAGDFAKSVEAVHETNQFKLNAAMSALQVTLIDLGGTVMPLVASALQKITVIMGVLVGWWDKLSPTTQKWIAISLALLAVLGPIMVILGSLVTATGVVVSAIGTLITFVTAAATATAAFGGTLLALSPWILVIIAAVVALGFAAYEMWKHWDVVRGFLIAMWNDIKTATKVAIDFIIGLVVIFLNFFVPNWKTTLAQVAQLWQDAWTGIHDAFVVISKTIQDAIGATLDWISTKIGQVVSAWNAMVSLISKPISGVTGAIGGILSSVSNSVKGALNTVVQTGNSITNFSGVPQFAEGGIVPGTFGQAVPIIAHAGEKVIPVDQVGSAGDGYNFTFNFNNPVIQTSENLRDMVEMALRDVVRGHKLTTI